MKASGKTLGALALSAALALGCAVPAFGAVASDNPYGARDQDYSDPTTNLKQGDTAETTVNIATMTTNINVTVPLNVTVVADSAGGAILAPTTGLKHNTGDAYDGKMNTGYRIENYSTYPVAIKQIQTTQHTNNRGDWALVAALAADGTTQQGNVADMVLNLGPSSTQNDAAGINEGSKGTGGAVNLANTITPTDPGWIIQRQVSKTEPAIMGLQLSGTNSALINVNESSILLGDAANPQPDTNGDGYPDDPVAADNAFKIIYTVGAAKTTV